MALEEVIVTAEKREQNLQTTAISITAYTAGMLDDLWLQTVEELADFAPNVTMRPSDRAGGR